VPLKSPKFASWQRSILCGDGVSLAQLERGAGVMGWCVTFPSGSPLLTRANEAQLMAGAEGHPTFWQARRYANDLALAQGYQILGAKAGWERFKTLGDATRLS
jgi:hypothetical protein